MSSLPPLLLLFLCGSLPTTLALPSKERHFKWEVEYIYWSPDCVENMMIGINGRFPGPTIRARVGDTIVVELKNSLPTEGVVIHWHGIRQFGTPWYDGAASISQCAINPDETFVYRFKVDKAGTYFYHGHYGMQRAAGLYGSLIVDLPEGVKEPFHYDGELNLLLSDWWHRSVQDQMTGLSARPFRWIDEPQTLLINGRGQYNCSLAAQAVNGTSAAQPRNGTMTCEITSKECEPVVLKVLPQKTYRLRIGSITSLASLNLAIGVIKSGQYRCLWWATCGFTLSIIATMMTNHKMTVVEADGNYVEPFDVVDMDIYSGESYSILITTDQIPTVNYWISVGVRGRLPETQPALAILNYRPNSPSKVPKSAPPTTPTWNDYNHSKTFSYKIMARQGTPKPPINSNRQIALLNTQNEINGYIKWSINNISLVLPTTPYLGAMKYGLKSVFDAKKPPENFPKDYDIMKPPINPNTTEGSMVYKLGFNHTVDVIIQNANALSDNVSELHPWHLHGHDFWVLGYGEGRFHKPSIANFNLNNPPLRNTVVVFPYGWTAIRFVADNPGVWPFHCHIEPHLHMGMGIVFAEGIQHVGKIPKEAISCGVTGKMLNKNHLP